MIETVLGLLAGLGLSAAAGLNAYIPLLVLGLGDRFLDFVALPEGWSWLANEWVLGILAVLLAVELVADKVPAVDSVNDWIQTIVRPASGGIVFGSGAASETVAVQDPEAFFSSDAWVPIVVGVVIALLVHLAKASIRPVLNTVTFGLAAPVTSAIEDVASIIMSVLAVLSPLFVILAIAGLVAAFVSVLRRTARTRRERRMARNARRPAPEGTGLA